MTRWIAALTTLAALCMFLAAALSAATGRNELRPLWSLAAAAWLAVIIYRERP